MHRFLQTLNASTSVTIHVCLPWYHSCLANQYFNVIPHSVVGSTNFITHSVVGSTNVIPQSVAGSTNVITHSVVVALMLSHIVW